MNMETTHNVDNTTIEQEQRSQVDRTWAATLAKCQPQQDATGRTEAAFSGDPVFDRTAALARDSLARGYEIGVLETLYNVKELLPEQYMKMLTERAKSDGEVFANRVIKTREAQQ